MGISCTVVVSLQESLQIFTVQIREKSTPASNQERENGTILEYAHRILCLLQTKSRPYGNSFTRAQPRWGKGNTQTAPHVAFLSPLRSTCEGHRAQKYSSDLITGLQNMTPASTCYHHIHWFLVLLVSMSGFLCLSSPEVAPLFWSLHALFTENNKMETMYFKICSCGFTPQQVYIKPFTVISGQLYLFMCLAKMQLGNR